VGLSWGTADEEMKVVAPLLTYTATSPTVDKPLSKHEFEVQSDSSESSS
jgi:hypothetical protein